MYDAARSRAPQATSRAPYARLRLALLLLLTAPLLSGCILLDLAFVVRDDGTALFSQLVALDTALIEAAPDLETALGDIAAGDLGVPLTHVSVTPYDEAGWRGHLLQGEFDPRDAAILARLLLPRVETPAGEAAPALSITREGDDWIFDVTVPPPDPGGVLAVGGPFAATAAFTVRVLLPGHVIDHNADRADGAVLIWDIAFDQSGSRSLTARSQPGAPDDSALSVPLLPLGVLALVTVGGAAAWWWLPLGRFSRRRESDIPEFILKLHAALRARLARRRGA